MPGPFNSQVAERIGLVNQVVIAKALLKHGMIDAITAAMSRELDLCNERLASPQVKAAVGRFFAK